MCLLARVFKDDIENLIEGDRNTILATGSAIAPDPDFTGQDYFDCRTINKFSAIGINNWICGYN